MAKQKAIITGHDGREVSIITKAENVLFDNGDTAQSILETDLNKTFTPTIENSSPMFKVGQGDSVDYSENVVDGAYGSCVLNGRTLVNVASKVINKPANSTTDDIAFTLTTYTDKWQSIVYDKSLLKPNTKYTVFLTVLQNDSSHTLPIKVQLGNSTSGFMDIKKGYNGRLTITLTTANELPDTLSVGIRSSTIAGEVVKVSNFIVLEGEYLNEDFPYFTGICDVKSPILSNVGKNLFDIGQIQYREKALAFKQEVIDQTIKVTNLGTGGAYLSDNTNYPFLIQKGKTYTISYDYEKTGNANAKIRLFTMDEVGVTTTYVNDERSTGKVTFTADRTLTAYISFYSSTLSTSTIGDYVIYKNIQFEETASKTGYESYKSNILTCETYFDEVSQSDKPIILRSLPNDMCDTLNVDSGEYTVKIGERAYQIGDLELLDVYTNGVVTRYKLTTPIVHKVDVSEFPFAYKGGHVIVSSGSVEQSLTPKVEYSLPINRNGQIQVNQKMVEKQQKQLDYLEKMVIANVVVSEYEQTLTSLNYELSRV